MSKLNTTQFIIKAKAKHGDKYDYSRVEYVHHRTKVVIMCPKHGEFKQTPNAHLFGYGCAKCAGNVKKTTEQFIEEAIRKHGNKYNYNKVAYVNDKKKVILACPEHGKFVQTPHEHLDGCGCPQCAGNIRRTTEQFAEKAKLIHGDKYNYSRVQYINAYSKIIIICNKHGEFIQTANDHICGYGCSKCGDIKYKNSCRSNVNEFIEKARRVHGNKYDYSKVEYYNSQTKITIICKRHNEFKQAPDAHLLGHGCSRCCESRGEKRIHRFFERYHIKYKSQVRFMTCKRKFSLPFDFATKQDSKLLLIEYHGIQHYQISPPMSCTQFELDDLKERDEIKKKWCEINRVRLLIIPYTEYRNINKILMRELLK